jgi:hypothetical protein
MEDDNELLLPTGRLDMDRSSGMVANQWWPASIASSSEVTFSNPDVELESPSTGCGNKDETKWAPAAFKGWSDGVTTADLMALVGSDDLSLNGKEESVLIIDPSGDLA